MADTSTIVERLGGAEKLAERFGITRKAIEMWERRGGIPRSRQLEILLLAKEQRVRLSPHDLPTQSQRAAA